VTVIASTDVALLKEVTLCLELSVTYVTSNDVGLYVTTVGGGRNWPIWFSIILIIVSGRLLNLKIVFRPTRALKFTWTDPTGGKLNAVLLSTYCSTGLGVLQNVYVRRGRYILESFVRQLFFCMQHYEVLLLLNAAIGTPLLKGKKR
jgi:hypothetical protein